MQFNEFLNKLKGEDGSGCPPLSVVIRMYNQAWKPLEKVSDGNYIHVYCPDTGDLIQTVRNKEKPVEHFKNKTLYDVECLEDFDILIQGTEGYNTTVDKDIVRLVEELSPTEAKLYRLLVENLLGANTGVLRRELAKAVVGKDWQRRGVKLLKDKCLIKEIDNPLSKDYLTYQLPPYYVFRGSDAAKEVCIGKWVEYSREHNHQTIQSLPDKPRDEISGYRAS